jgi:hypothetical protein
MTRICKFASVFALALTLGSTSARANKVGTHSVVVDRTNGIVAFKVQLDQPRNIPTARVFAWVPRTPTTPTEAKKQPWKKIYLDYMGQGAYGKKVSIAGKKIDLGRVDTIGVAFGADFARTVKRQPNPEYRPTDWFQGAGDNTFPQQ